MNKRHPYMFSEQQMKPVLVLFCMVALCFFSGCSTKADHAAINSTVVVQNEHSDGFDDFDDFEDYDTDPVEVIADPLEPFNRFWFGFNDFFILNIADPVYTGYTYIMPAPFRQGISNFAYNIKAPVRIFNRILQGEFGQAWVELGKFVVNSTAGFGGLFDITKDKKPKVPYKPTGADFGTTLATWGVGEGFYVVWPFFGPSSARDTVGMGMDFLTSPTTWVSHYDVIDSPESYLITGGLRFNDFGSVIAIYKDMTEGAIEPYVSMRDAYIRYRQGLVMPD